MVCVLYLQLLGVRAELSKQKEDGAKMQTDLKGERERVTELENR